MSASQIDEQIDGRERLLDAARAMFAERGFTDVSINEIAQAAGMTRSAPYYHFKNKEDLYAAVLTRQFAGFYARIEEEVAAVTGLRAQLLAVLEVATQALGSSFGRSKGDYQSHVSPEVRAAIAERVPPPSTVFMPIFQRAFDAGEFSRTSPETAFQMFFMMLIGYREMLGKDDDCTPSPFRIPAPSPETFIDILLLGI
jgi:AcrR family transcriptional regulator